MADEPQQVLLHVTVVYCVGPRQVIEHEVQVAPRTTLEQALQGLRSNGLTVPVEAEVVEAGIWGRKVPLSQTLRDGDRVELYRALRVDPKVARRLRFQTQGARATGLFARRRPNAKPGY